jgi:hypothetical protein
MENPRLTKELYPAHQSLLYAAYATNPNCNIYIPVSGATGTATLQHLRCLQATIPTTTLFYARRREPFSVCIYSHTTPIACSTSHGNLNLEVLTVITDEVYQDDLILPQYTTIVL